MDALYRKPLIKQGQFKDATAWRSCKIKLLWGVFSTEHKLLIWHLDTQQAVGALENFGRKMLGWSKDANISVANKIYMNLKSPLECKY